MNVARFQFILNQEDLDVITKGLIEFSTIVLQEHQQIENFGYCGRSNSNEAEKALNASLPQNVCGLLQSYISSSPQVEELFIVWFLVDRSSSYALCSALNHCITVILHCAASIPALCNHIVNRILLECWKNINAMLASNNTDLVHSCLGLLIAICRTSKNNCSQIIQKMNFNDSIFTSMIQKGKARQTNLKIGNYQVTTVDARTLLILLIFTLIRDTDDAGVTKILASNSIIKKIMHGLTKDAAVNTDLFLNCINYLISHNINIRAHIVDIVDAAALEKLFNLYSTDDDMMQTVVARFELNFTNLCSRLLSSGEGKQTYGIKTCLSNVIKQLKPHKSEQHRQLQIDVLNQHPNFLHLCMNCDNFSWDVINTDYLSMLDHITNMLTRVDIDSKLKSSIKSNFSLWESGNKQVQSSLSVSIVQSLITSLIPSRFSKVEIMKLLQHSNNEVVLLGLNFLRAVVVRLQKIFSECGISKGLFCRVVTSQLFNWLPELNLLLDISLKSIRMASNNNSLPMESTGKLEVVPETMEVDDFDFNFLEGANKQSMPVKTAIEVKVDETSGHCTYHSVSLEVMSLYVSLFGSSNTVTNCDVLKLLNEIVQWPTNSNALTARDAIQALNQTSLSSILVVLKRTSSTSMNWFGTRNDSVKGFCSLMQESETSVYPQNSLSRLFLLCTIDDPVVSNDAMALLKAILTSSGLFTGHGTYDYQLYCEEQCWLGLILQSSCEQISILCGLLALSFHFNAEISCSIQTGTPVALSSVSLCLLKVISGDFRFLAESSKQVRTVSNSFIRDAKLVLLRFLNISSQLSSVAVEYFQAMETVMKSLNASNENFSDIQNELHGYLHLYSLINSSNSSLSIKDTMTKMAAGMKNNLAYSCQCLAYYSLNLNECIASQKIDKKILEQNWFLVSLLHVVCNRSIDKSCLTWIEEKWALSFNLMNGVEGSTYRKSLFCQHSIVLSKALMNVCDVEEEQAPPIKKRKTDKAKFDVLDNKIKESVNALCKTVLTRMQQLIESSVLNMSAFITAPISSLLLDNFLCTSSHGIWCQQLLTFLSQFCLTHKIQSKLLASLWSKISDLLVNYLQKTHDHSQNIIDLCQTVYGQTKSVSLRAILSKIVPDAHFNDPSSNFSVNEIIKESKNYNELSNRFLVLCQSARNNIETPIVRTSEDYFDVCCLFGDPQAIINTFSSSNDYVRDTLRFLSSHFPTILSGKTIFRSSIETSKSHNELLLTALSLTVNGVSEFVESIHLTSDRLDKFMNQIVLSQLKGKLLNALTALSKLLIRLKANKALQKFLVRFVQQSRFMEDRMLLDDFLSQPLLETLINDTNDNNEMWFFAYCQILKLYLSSCSNYLIKTELVDQNTLGTHLSRILSLMAIDWSSFGEELYIEELSFEAELSKWIKCCLKYGINMQQVLSSLLKITETLKLKQDNSLWQRMTVSTTASICQPQQLFNMITGHSKLVDIMHGHDSELKCGLIRLQLTLLRQVLAMHKVSDIQSSLQFLCEILWPLYRGTISLLDKLILQLFLLLETKKCLTTNLRIQNMACDGVKFSFENEEKNAYISESWLLDYISPPLVYSTIANFSFARSFTSASEHDEVSTQSELTGYDLIYFLPVIFNTLRNFDVSIRRLTNCGGLSLLLLGLCSKCSVTRSYSLSSLHLVYLLLHKQTPEVDPSFRERSQLMLVLNWLKNSFIQPKDKYLPDYEMPSVTPMFGVFLGRAVLNIMQPNHELYSIINKYILGKPWCDPGDLPLFDFLLTQSDSQTQVSERLAVLRLLRDGLLSPLDHTSMTRKNAYNRLILVFDIHSNDARIGHAILDILEKGLLVMSSAKYLIERCELLSLIYHITTNPQSKYRLRALILLKSVISYCHEPIPEQDSCEFVNAIRRVLLNLSKDLSIGKECTFELLLQFSLCLWEFSLKLGECGVADSSWEETLLMLNDLCTQKQYDNQLKVSFLLLMAFSNSVQLKENYISQLLSYDLANLNLETKMAEKNGFLPASMNIELFLWCATKLVSANTPTNEIMIWCLRSWHYYSSQQISESHLVIAKLVDETYDLSLRDFVRCVLISRISLVYLQGCIGNKLKFDWLTDLNPSLINYFKVINAIIMRTTPSLYVLQLTMELMSVFEYIISVEGKLGDINCDAQKLFMGWIEDIAKRWQKIDLPAENENGSNSTCLEVLSSLDNVILDR